MSLPRREHLFWISGTPPAGNRGTFDVRRVETNDDVVAMQSIFAEAHDYAEELTGAMYGESVRVGTDLTGWIAWDGADAVSFTIVTRVGPSLGLWEVMTPVRHRRRGAARAVVSAALAGVAQAAESDGQPIEQTLFWSSPAGQPLYAAMGFTVVDTIDAWALGASAADLAAVGA